MVYNIIREIQVRRIHTMKRMFAIAAFFAAAAFGAFADGMKEALQPYVDSGELPGAISILYDNGREETVCVGYADVAAKRAITADEFFATKIDNSGIEAYTGRME